MYNTKERPPAPAAAAADEERLPLRLFLRAAVVSALLGFMLPLAGSAQRVVPVPQLALPQLDGVWYEVARLPAKAEKKCVSDSTMLFARGNKDRTFQRGLFCFYADGSTQDVNSTGKRPKQGDGRLKINRFFFFSTKFWVLGLGPNHEWALAGTPNHKSLWVLSRTQTLPPEASARILSMAAAQGFDTGKLITVVQHPGRSAISAAGVAPPKIAPNSSLTPKGAAAAPDTSQP